MDMLDYLHRHIWFSQTTFGPGKRTEGIIKHIKKELIEVEQDPESVEEWIDVVILALDGAWRAGHSEKAICLALVSKQRKNMARKWPNWRDYDVNQPIEHIREEE